jgi:hypothetical protein
MANVIVSIAAMTACALVSCNDLDGLANEESPPLAIIQVEATGDFETVRTPSATDPDLRVAMVWGLQWLPEPLCFLPPESPEAAAVIAAGCRNVFSFTPNAVAATAPFTIGVQSTIELGVLPPAELMVGDITARVAYATFVIFDDRDHSGTLEFPRPQRLGNGRGPGGGPGGGEQSKDIVYASSFVSMTEPDTRLAFREGAFVETGFFPRHGCNAPPAGFSIVSAGGFTFEDAITATLAGTLPSQAAGSCSEAKANGATVSLPFRPASDVGEVACEQRRTDSSVRYRQPPMDPIDFTDRTFACTKIPKFAGEPEAEGVVQLVVSGKAGDACKSISHFTLVGCDDGTFSCGTYEWDLREKKPSWWPCL